MGDVDFLLYQSNFSEYPDKNGGKITNNIIEAGVINNLFSDIRAFCVEAGCERWGKFFIKANVNLVNVGICLGLTNFNSGDKVSLAKGGDDEVESDLDKENLKLYENFIVKAFDKKNKTIQVDRLEYVEEDDFITFFNSADERICMYQVESVDKDNKKIKFKAINDRFELKGCIGSNTIILDKLQKDKYQGFWVKENILAQKLPFDNPIYFKIYIFYEKE